MNLKREVKKKVKSLLSYFKVDTIYNVCQFYINAYDNVNNSYMDINGELYVIKNYVAKCGVLIDVGAGDGEYTCYAIKYNPELECYCYEPSERVNNIPSQKNIKVRKIGLGESESKKTLFLNPETGAPTFVKKNKGVIEDVQISTLDNEFSFLKNRPTKTFLKIDTEGFELEVIKGGTDLLREGKIDFVQFEYSSLFYHQNIYLKDIYNFVQKINSHYMLYKIWPRELRPVEKISHNLENYKDANYLLILENG